MTDIPGDDGQLELEGGRRDQQIGAAMPDAGGEASPTPGNRRDHWEDAVIIQLDGAIEP